MKTKLPGSSAGSLRDTGVANSGPIMRAAGVIST